MNDPTITVSPTVSPPPRPEEGEVIDIDSRIDQIVADAVLREREGVLR